MRAGLGAMAALCAALCGCVTPPETEPASENATSDTPAAARSPAEDADATTAAGVLEQHHHRLALEYMREGQWADALVQWELLALLRPASREYQDALAQTRKRIASAAAGLLRSAEQAWKNGNPDQAAVLYLRVLNIDRENAAAARALREIDEERTKRAYLNRPPRGNM